MLGRIKSFLGLETKSAGVRLSDPAALSVLFGGAETFSGVTVTPEIALNVPAAYSAIRCIAESVSSLPLTLFQTDTTGAKTKATAHPLFDLLSGSPNDWTTSYEFRLHIPIQVRQAIRIT